MGLTSVLLDRARLVRKAASATKVGGRTTFVDTEPGTWFAARLQMPSTQAEQQPADFVAKRIVPTPTLMYAPDDDIGNPVEVRFSDMLEVESEDLGNALWQVTTEPEPYRKKRGIIGFEVQLRRVESHEFEQRVA